MTSDWDDILLSKKPTEEKRKETQEKRNNRKVCKATKHIWEWHWGIGNKGSKSNRS